VGEKNGGRADHHPARLTQEASKAASPTFTRSAVKKERWGIPKYASVLLKDTIATTTIILPPLLHRTWLTACFPFLQSQQLALLKAVAMLKPGSTAKTTTKRCFFATRAANLAVTQEIFK
jgi:hypothetical protein